MRILIINLRIGTGSVGRIVSDIYHGIVENGHQCLVAYARGGIGDLPKEDTIRICSDFEVKKHVVLTRIFGNTAFWSKNSTKSFLKKIDDFKPDIIHIHGLYGYYINMEELFEYIKEHNIKLISTLHSCWDFTGHCCYFDYVQCNQWKTGCKNCEQKSSYPKSSFLDNTSYNFSRKKRLYDSLSNCTIVTPSNWLANLARESFLGFKDIKVIPNGINRNSFHEIIDVTLYEKYGIDSNKTIILGVASIWDRRKGLDDFIELSKHITSDYQIVVVGLDEKQISLLPNNVIGIRHTDSIKELASLYSMALVFFNPTYEDNYPTVNLEAIACNTPVVTYNTGGSPEIVEKLNFGKVISYKNYNELIKYCDYIKSNKISLSDEDINIICENNMKEDYIKLYEKVKKDH